MSRVSAKTKVLEENDKIAAELRGRHRESGTMCVNLIGSPGSGKTALLERTLARIPGGVRAAVLTGDIETENDAKRLEPFGFPVRQITTGGACHLDARMVSEALQAWGDEHPDLLFIENVGNLVCPSSFDLGEAAKVVVTSVTEGDDKPSKYPATFLKAGFVVLNKLDLLPHVPFDVDHFRENVERVRPEMPIAGMSCTTGHGIENWMRWLLERLEAARAEAKAGASHTSGDA
ncbi:MAG: hydrogenase nickel incorporation protein HypB [Candidatus Eiseniibacteriota bacterium]